MTKITAPSTRRTSPSLSCALLVSLLGLPIVASAALPPSYFFVATGSNTIVLDLATNAIVKSIPFTTGPSKLEPSYDGSLMFAANNLSAGISVIDVQTLTPVSTIALFASGSECIDASSNFKDVFVCGNGNLGVFDATLAVSNPAGAIRTNNNLGLYQNAYFAAGVNGVPGITGLRLSPDGKILYVGGNVFGSPTQSVITVIDAIKYPTNPAGAFIKAFVLPQSQGANIYRIRFSTDSSRAYVSMDSNLTLAGYQTNQHTLIQNFTMPITGLLTGSLFRHDGAAFYDLTHNFSALNAVTGLWELAPSSFTLFRRIPMIPGGPGETFEGNDIDISTDNRTAFVTGKQDTRFGTFKGVVKVDLPTGNRTNISVGTIPQISAIAGRLSIPRASPFGPPAAITDVRVATATGNSITFNWTASGAQGNTGTASSYQIRYATFPILTEAAFAISTPVAAPPAPLPAGSTETFVLAGLASDTTYFLNVRAVANVTQVGGLSNSPGAKTLDVIAPSAVTNLVATSVFFSSVTLTWTAPGNNGTIGQVARYDIRYATFPITTEAFFAQAVAVSTWPSPRPAGGLETFVLTGLAQDSTFFFSVRGVDASSNVGGLSNSPLARTRDGVAPSTITTLSVTVLSATALSYAWTATGDNGGAGTASSYDFRYATYPILTDALFNGATRAFLPPPAAAGAQESFILNGLSGDTTYYASLKAMDEAGNMGGLSNDATAHTLDTVPPAAITGLSVKTVAANSITLTWTAVGDNATQGRAAVYDLRYALTPIVTAGDFTAATPVPGLPQPQLPGFLETAAIPGLVSDTTYYVAVRAVDEAGNAGALSNVVSTHTVDILPPAAIGDLSAQTGANKGQVRLQWTAVGDNGLSGRATRYVIKASLSPIAGQADFNSAQTLSQSTVPAAPGALEVFVAGGLLPDRLYYLAVEAVDEAGNAGALSNAASALSQRDFPPAAIADLTSSAPSSHTVLLSWTATGDEGAAGRAASYDLRWSLSPISEGNFASANPVAGVPIPQSAGSAENFAVPGLPAESRVYFALKAIDTAGQPSALSNMATTDTTGEAAVAAYIALPQTVTSGQSAAIRVLVSDDQGRPVPRLRVSFAVISGGGSFSPASAFTDANGIAQADFAPPSGVNEIDTIRATVEGFQSLQASLIVLTGSLATIEGFPTTPVVFTAGPTTVSSTSLAFQWFSTDPSGIADNYVMIGSEGGMGLGGWIETSPLATLSGQPFSFLTALNGYLYFFGINGTTPVSRYSQIQPDGSLGAWQATLAPPATIISGFVHGGSIYAFAVGGAAYRPTIDAAGRVTAWTQAGADFLVTNRIAYDAGVTVAGYAYLIGGNNPAFNVFSSSLVYVAKIQANGSIPAPGQVGGWKQTTPLPAYYSSLRPAPRLIAVGSYLYVLGGTQAKTVFYARPNADGTIPAAGLSGSWAPTTQLPEANTGISAAASNGVIYLPGGDDGGSPGFQLSARVFRATPAADGRIPALGTAGSWKLSTRLPSGLMGRSVVAGGRLYTYDHLTGKVRFAEIQPDGNLGSWRRHVNRVLTGPQAGTSPTQRHAFAWAAAPVPGGSRVFLAGGAPQGSNNPVADVFALSLPAPFTDGSGAEIDALEWRPATSLPKALRGAAAVTAGGYLYVLGGVDSLGDLNGSIYSAAINPDPLQSISWSAAGTTPLSNAEMPIAAVLNGYLYYAAIGLGRAEVWGAPLGGGGSVGSFTKMASLPGPTFGAGYKTLLGHRGYLYAVVGNEVYSALPDASGNVASWRTESLLPTGGTASGPLRFGLSASGQTLYATGGVGDVNPLTVYSAAIGNNGVLGPWTALGHMPEARNAGVAVVHDDRLLTFGPRMDFPTGGQLAAVTGTFYADSLVARIRLSGSDAYGQSVGTASDLFATGLSLLRGQSYYASVRTKNPAGVPSRLGASGGVAVLPSGDAPDMLPPRTTLHIGLPSSGADPTFVSPATPFSFTFADDRATVGDTAGEGVRTVIAALDGIIISTDPAATVHLSTEGPHVFSFYAIDAIGNTEQLQQLGVIVDGSEPATEILFPQPFDVVSGTYAVVQGVAVDTFSFIDRILVSTNNDVSFSTAVILQVVDGVAYWQVSAPLPSQTSTVTIRAHAVDLVGNYDSVGSSMPVLVFNVINTTMAIGASPRVASPGTLVLIQAQALTQLGGPLSGLQVTFSATVSNTLDPGAAAGGVPMPAVSFAPSVAVTDEFGVATTTLAVGGFDAQFTRLVEQYAAFQFCIDAAPLVGMTPAECPRYQTVALTATFMLQTGISNGTLTTQAQADAVSAQFQTIAQEQFAAASSALFNKSIGVITVTATTAKTTKPPFVSSASIKTNLLSIPYPAAITGLPTSDNGEQPNSITYGDNNTATPFPLPGQTDSSYGRPQPDSELVNLAAARSGGGAAGGGYRTAGLFEDVMDGITNVVDKVFNFIDPGRISADKMFMVGDFITKYANNYLFNTVPGARLALFASAFGMDFLTGSHQARDLAAEMAGDRVGLSLADLATFGILPPAVTKLIPPGLSVGLDVSGALAGKPKFGLNAGYKLGTGTLIGYNSVSGVSLSQQIDGLQTYFNKDGFNSSVNLSSLLADTAAGQFTQHYGLKSLSVGLLSGSYTGRISVDIAKIKPSFDGKQFLKSITADYEAGRFGALGRMFKNVSAWASGESVSFKNTGIKFDQSSLTGGLGFGKIAIPKPDFGGINAGAPISLPPTIDPGKITEGLTCAASPSIPSVDLNRYLNTPANTYQSLALNSGSFSAASSIAGVTRHPVNSATGNLLYSVQDALVRGKPLFIQFVRIYNSLDFGNGPLGHGWSFNYGMSVAPYGQDGVMAVKWGDGSRKVFLPNPDGSYRAPYATDSALSKAVDGTFTLTQKRGTRYHFDLEGRLDRIIDRNANAIVLAYGASGLESITDPAGRQLVFQHDAVGRITRLTDPSGAQTQYTYDAAGDLVGVTAPDYAAVYGYGAQHALTSYHDARSQTGFPNGGFEYNTFRQVTAETDGLGQRVSGLAYALENGGVRATVTDAALHQTVDRYDDDGIWTSRTDALGGVTRYAFDAAGRMTQVTDADGGVTRLAYDSRGNKTSVTQPTGAEYVYVYDAKNNLTAATLPNNGQISRTYDAAGNLATITDAEGNLTRFVYGAGGLLNSVTDSAGKTTTLGYDAAGNLDKVDRPGGGTRRLAHDALGRLTATTDENGHTTSFARNAGGALSVITYPEGQTYSFAYDANGKLERETDPMGQVTRYVNDARGYLTQVIDAAGETASVIYDAVGRPISRTDRAGGVSTTEYDALDRVTKETDPIGGVYRFAYDAVGRRTAITDPTGSVLALSYDAGGRPATITSPEGSVTRLAYDAMGNLVSQTDPAGGVSTYEYDRTGLVTKLTDALGQETAVRYDAAGRVDKVTEPNGAERTFTYNPDGFLASHTDGGGRTVRYEVDMAGLLSSVKDGLDRETRYQHRWNGQLTRLTRPDGAIIRFDYDARGALTTLTDANGRVTRYDHTATGLISKVTDAKGQAMLYDFDEAGRPTVVTYPDGSTFRMFYDAAGRLTSFKDGMGSTHEYVYDLAGQLIREKDLNGNQWTFVYDGDGRMTTATDPMGGVAQHVYDAMGRLITQTNPNGGITRFVYDAVSRMTEATDPAGGVVKWTYDGVGNMLSHRDPNGNLTRWAYNLSNDVTSITDAAGSVRSFAYDLAGQLLTVTGPLGDVTRYLYDAVGRLAKRTDPVGAETAYVYDLSGNRVRETDPMGRVATFSYDELNRMTSAAGPLGTQTYLYDASNRLVSQTDAAGRTASFAYRADGLMTSQTGPDGSVIRYEYDANGNRTAVVDPAGGRTVSEYDALNRLTRITAADGSRVSYAYDANGNRTSVTDGNSKVTSYAFDLMNRLTSLTDPNGGVTLLAYDAAGNRTRATDPTSKVTTFVYDMLGRLLRTIDAAGGETVATYDAAGRPLSTTDPAGSVTSRTYDLAGHLLTVTTPSGGVTRYLYDALGRLIKETDGLGRETRTIYDAQGRVTETVDALSRSTLYAYDAAGNRTSVTDALGLVTSFEYDANGRMTAALDPLQNRTRYAYDSRGNRISRTDPEGHVTSFEYDQESRLAAVVNAVGGRATFAYDGNGRKLTETGPDGAVTRFEYDANGRLTAVVDPLGRRVTHEYDADGRMTRAVDARGNATRYAYDDLGRLSQVTDAEGGVWAYSYDAVGRLTRILDANGHAQTFVYDAAGRLASQADALGNATRFEYDVLGKRTKLIKPGGGELRYEYDAGDRVVFIRDQSASVLASMSWDALNRLTGMSSPDISAGYAYDGAGRLTQLTYPTLGRALSLTYDKDGLRKSLAHGGDLTSYAYDAAHRLTTLNSRVGAAQGEYAFSHDAAGRPVERRYPNGVVASLAYDAGGQLLALSYRRPGGAQLGRFTYQYDANGNRVSAKDNLGARSYGYDKLNRLTGVQEPAGVTQAYVYDPVGNRTRLTNVRKNRTTPLPAGQAAQTTEIIAYTYDIADRLLQAGATSYVFDAVGRLASVQFPSHVASYEYDAYDRPSKISGLKSRLTGEGLPDSLYAYAPQMPDLRFTPAPLGARTRKTDSRGVAQYVMDEAGNIAAELDGAGAPVRRYTNGLDGDQPLAVHDAQGEARYLLTDAMGSVAMVVDRNADPVQTYRYEAFGRPSAVAEDGLKFTGKPFDPDAQLQLHGARYMDPDTGRWITRDPLMLTSRYYRAETLSAPQALNPCAYAQSNPATYRDSTGLSINQEYVGTLDEAAAVIRKRTGRISCSGSSFNGLADDFANVRGRFVWTKKGGWIDFRHFFQTAALINVPLMGPEVVYGIGISKENGQLNNRGDVAEFKSAFSVEDLPSNRYGINFGAKFGYFTMQNFEKSFVDFVNSDLGGTAPAPLGIGDFNRVRNFSDRPILNPADSSILTHSPSGQRYMPVGIAETDEKILKALVEGMASYGLTPDRMAIP